MNVNADALSRNPIINEERSRNLHEDNDDIFVTSQEKMNLENTFIKSNEENNIKKGNMQKGSRTKVDSDSDSDPDSDPEYLDYLKEIQAEYKRNKNVKKPKQFIIPQEEESKNYFSTSEDEVVDRRRKL